MSTPVERWLETFMCKQYADIFEACGYKTLQSVCQLDGHQLRSMGVLPEHCEKIMENVSVLQQSYMAKGGNGGGAPAPGQFLPADDAFCPPDPSIDPVVNPASSALINMSRNAMQRGRYRSGGSEELSSPSLAPNAPSPMGPQGSMAPSPHGQMTSPHAPPLMSPPMTSMPSNANMGSVSPSMPSYQGPGPGPGMHPGMMQPQHQGYYGNQYPQQYQPYRPPPPPQQQQQQPQQPYGMSYGSVDIPQQQQQPGGYGYGMRPPCSPYGYNGANGMNNGFRVAHGAGGLPPQLRNAHLQQPRENPQQVADSILQMASQQQYSNTGHVRPKLTPYGTPQQPPSGGPFQPKPFMYSATSTPSQSPAYSNPPTSGGLPLEHSPPVSSPSSLCSPSGPMRSPHPPNAAPSPRMMGAPSPMLQHNPVSMQGPFSPSNNSHCPQAVYSECSGFSQPPTQLSCAASFSSATSVPYSSVGDSAFSTANYSTSSYSTASYSTASYSTASYSTASYSTASYSTASYSSAYPPTSLSSITSTNFGQSGCDHPIAVSSSSSNPLMSLQKLVLLPESQVVDPKSVVNDACLGGADVPKLEEALKSFDTPPESHREEGSQALGPSNHDVRPAEEVGETPPEKKRKKNGEGGSPKKAKKHRSGEDEEEGRQHLCEKQPKNLQGDTIVPSGPELQVAMDVAPEQQCALAADPPENGAVVSPNPNSSAADQSLNALGSGQSATKSDWHDCVEKEDFSKAKSGEIITESTHKKKKSKKDKSVGKVKKKKKHMDKSLFRSGLVSEKKGGNCMQLTRKELKRLLKKEERRKRKQEKRLRAQRKEEESILREAGILTSSVDDVADTKTDPLKLLDQKDEGGSACKEEISVHRKEVATGVAGEGAGPDADEGEVPKDEGEQEEDVMHQAEDVMHQVEDVMHQVEDVMPSVEGSPCEESPNNSSQTECPVEADHAEQSQAAKSPCAEDGILCMESLPPSPTSEVPPTGPLDSPDAPVTLVDNDGALDICDVWRKESYAQEATSPVDSIKENCKPQLQVLAHLDGGGVGGDAPPLIDRNQNIRLLEQWGRGKRKRVANFIPKYLEMSSDELDEEEEGSGERLGSLRAGLKADLLRLAPSSLCRSEPLVVFPAARKEMPSLGTLASSNNSRRNHHLKRKADALNKSPPPKMETRRRRDSEGKRSPIRLSPTDNGIQRRPPAVAPDFQVVVAVSSDDDDEKSVVTENCFGVNTQPVPVRLFRSSPTQPLSEVENPLSLKSSLCSESSMDDSRATPPAAQASSCPRSGAKPKGGLAKPKRRKRRKKLDEYFSDDGSIKDVRLKRTIDNARNACRKKKAVGSRLPSRAGGPYVRIWGPRDCPSSCDVVNTEDTDNVRVVRKKKAATEASLPSSVKFLDAVPWTCVFCGRGTSDPLVGQLYGPYYPEPSSPVASPTRSVSPLRRRSEDGTKARRKRSASRSESSSRGAPSLVPPEIWLHEDCAVWSSGVHFNHGKVHGLEEAVTAAKQTTCSVCKMAGASLGCLRKGCGLKYHYHCALERECHLDEENFSLVCPKHKRSVWNSKRQQKRENLLSASALPS